MQVILLSPGQRRALLIVLSTSAARPLYAFFAGKKLLRSHIAGFWGARDPSAGSFLICFEQVTRFSPLPRALAELARFRTGGVLLVLDSRFDAAYLPLCHHVTHSICLRLLSITNDTSRIHRPSEAPSSRTPPLSSFPQHCHRVQHQVAR
jgi:hypothetical protein